MKLGKDSEQLNLQLNGGGFVVVSWVFPKIGLKWMVKIMESLIKMDDLGVPLFLETPSWLLVV